jgi:hypothetical protein
VSIALQYGIIQVGQIWCVMNREGAQFGFPTRDRAVAAAEAMVSNHRESGGLCDVLVQDETGRLVPLPHGGL